MYESCSYYTGIILLYKGDQRHVYATCMLCQFITKIVTGYNRLSSTICQTFSSEKGFHVVNISAQINI